MANARTIEPRHADEILRYSATWASYTAAPSWNLPVRLDVGQGRARGPACFPALVALGLAAAAFADRRRRIPLVYLAVAAIAVDLSMGLHGVTYSYLYAHVGALNGLRAPARAAILVLMAIGVLAGFGATWLRRALPGARARTIATAVIVAALSLEYWSGPIPLAAQTTGVPDIYRFLRSVAPAIVLELPAPHADRLPGPDPMYEFWSMYHWNQLVNGYSGYYPTVYIRTLETLEKFPDENSMARLHRIGVRYIVVHSAGYERAAYTEFLLKLIARPDVQGAGAFKDEGGTEARLFELRESGTR